MRPDWYRYFQLFHFRLLVLATLTGLELLPMEILVCTTAKFAAVLIALQSM